MANEPATQPAGKVGDGTEPTRARETSSDGGTGGASGLAREPAGGLRGLVVRVEGTTLIAAPKGADANEVLVPTDGNTVVLLDGKRANLADLKAGLDVSVRPPQGATTWIVATTPGLRGRVVKVSGTKLVLALLEPLPVPDANTVTVSTDSNPVITLDGRAAKLADLRAPTLVTVVPATGVAARILATTQVARTGQVVRVEGTNLVIQRLAGVVGADAEEVAVPTDADTIVAIEANEAKLADLKPGMYVYATPAAGTAVRVNVAPQGRARVNLSTPGQIVQVVKVDGNNLVVKITPLPPGSSREVTVPVDANAAINIDGRKAALADLRAGMYVGVTMDPATGMATWLNVSSTPVVQAQIVNVDGNSLVVKTVEDIPGPAPKEMTVPVDPDAEITIGGRQAAFADLKAGAYVTVPASGPAARIRATPASRITIQVTGQFVKADGNNVVVQVAGFPGTPPVPARDFTFATNEATIVTLDGKDANLADLTGRIIALVNPPSGLAAGIIATSQSPIRRGPSSRPAGAGDGNAPATQPATQPAAARFPLKGSDYKLNVTGTLGHLAITAESNQLLISADGNGWGGLSARIFSDRVLVEAKTGEQLEANAAIITVGQYELTAGAGQALFRDKDANRPCEWLIYGTDGRAVLEYKVDGKRALTAGRRIVWDLATRELVCEMPVLTHEAAKHVIPASSPTTQPAASPPGLEDAGAAAHFAGAFRANVTAPLAAEPGAGVLAEFPSVRFETCYGNAWGVTGRFGFSPTRDQAWRVSVDLLDAQGKVMRHPRDGTTVIATMGDPAQVGATHWIDLPLHYMHFDGRWFPSGVRVNLQPVTAKPLGQRHLACAVVSAQDGKPLANAIVEVEEFKEETTKWLYVTSAEGLCRVDMPEGPSSSLRIAADKEGFARGSSSWDGNSAAVFRIALQPAQSLGGIVTDVNGKPIAGAVVQVESAPSFNRATQTDANGLWRLDGLHRNSDKVSIRLKHPEYVFDGGNSRELVGESLLETKALRRVDEMAMGSIVTGRILDARGRLVPGAAAILGREYARGRWSSYAHAQGDANGSFRFGNVPSNEDYGTGSFIVIGEAPGYAPAKATPGSGRRAGPVEIRLKPGRDIACRVVDPNGLPLAGVATVIEPFADLQGYSRWQEDADGEGHFVIHDAPDANVLLTVFKTGYFTLRDTEIAPAQAEQTIAMRPAVRIHGTVTDERTREPVKAFRVAFSVGYPAPEYRREPFADGKYEVVVDEDPATPRRVGVWAEGYGTFVSEPITLDKPDQVLDVKLTKGEGENGISSAGDGGGAMGGASTAAPAPLRLKGVVRDDAGKPLPGASVQVWGAGQDPALTNASGEFVFSTGWRQFPGPRGMLLIVKHKDRDQAAILTVKDANSPVEVKLEPAYVLTGQVLDPNGAPIAGTVVRLAIWIGENGCGFVAAQTDKEGHYRLETVPSWGEYDVDAQAKGYGVEHAKVRAADANGKVIAAGPLTLPRADLSVSGVVVDDQGKPLPRVGVRVTGAGQPLFRETLTNQAGKFTVQGVCAGRAQVTAILGNLQSAVQAQGGRTDVKIILVKPPPAGSF